MCVLSNYNPAPYELIRSDDRGNEKQHVNSRNPSDAEECKVVIENLTDETIYLCWLDFHGVLHHFEPIHSIGKIADGSVSNISTHFS